MSNASMHRNNIDDVLGEGGGVRQDSEQWPAAGDRYQQAVVFNHLSEFSC